MRNQDNPLLEMWASDLPPFGRIEPRHFPPAIKVLCDRHLNAVDVLAAREEEPTFDNTVAAFDATFFDLDRVRLTFENLCASMSSPALREIERELSPLLVGHFTRVALHRGFFARLDRVYHDLDRSRLSEEQDRLLQRVRMTFLRMGAGLEGEARLRFSEIEQRLAKLQIEFAQNVLADESSFYLPLITCADKAGLPDSLLASAREAAVQRGMEGAIITLSRSLVQPFLTWSSNRNLREIAWKAWTSRGESPTRDNRPLIRELLELRREKSCLLGEETYADYALRDRMACTPAEVSELLDSIWEPAKVKAVGELKELIDTARALGEPTEIEPWDWYYLAEQTKQTHFEVSEAEVRPYFSLDSMLGALFDCAGRLFQVELIEKPDVVSYHSDVRTWEVRRLGKPIGVLVGDYFSRPEKRSGAWTHVYQRQARNPVSTTSVVVNNLNFARSDGQTTLLSFDDVRTLFHEFGHALHCLLSDVTYAWLSGTSVPLDYVELPSQLMENWATVSDLLEKHARHVETGEVISRSMIERIGAARKFNQGYEAVGQTASAIIDMALHSLTELESFDASTFEAEECRRLGVPREIGLRHRLTSFNHIFGRGYYAAGYYAYIWAEVLEADVFDAFVEAGDLFASSVAEKLRCLIYSVGDSRDQAKAFRAFRGRDPVAAPWLRKRGLI